MFLTNSLSFFYDALLTLVYPQACAVCSEAVEARQFGIACAGCWQNTRTFASEDGVCWKCGALSSAAITIENHKEIRCRRCDDETFTAARACGVYEGALRASILALKRKPFVPGHVVALLEAIQQRSPLNRATRIIPVPLHPEREKARGFNQASVIGRKLAQALSLPLDEASLVRTVHAKRHRAGMDARARRKSVDRVFEVRYPRLIEDERVLLVDDVFTTGATASSCASALFGAGAKEVFVLTIARSLKA